MKFVDTLTGYVQQITDAGLTGNSNTLPRYVTIAIGSLAGAAGIWYLWRRYQDRNLPPGPTGWPLIGAAYLLRNESYLSDIEALSKKYGDVFSVQLGGSLMIFMTSYSAIKEALVTQGEVFACRPENLLSQLGLIDDIFSIPYQAPEWKDNKSFVLKCLRGAGFGSGKGTQEKVLEQINLLVPLMESLTKDGQSIKLRDILPKATLNVIYQIMYSKSFEYDDPQLAEHLQIIRNWASVFNDAQFLENAPTFFIKMLYRKKLADVTQRLNALQTIIRKEVEEHVKNHDPENPRDFVDMYLSQKGSKEGIDRCINNGVVFSVDATDTMAATIEWILLYATYYQDVQQKMFDEIEGITKGNRNVTWEDRSNLPYVEAVIKEVFRIRGPTISTAPHVVSKETLFRGYRIPERATIICLLQCVNNDSTRYPEPDQFKPEKFLNLDGTSKKTDAWIPFSMGRRMCPGEQLTRMEWFLFAANLIQTFKFTFAEGEDASLEPSEESSVLMAPKKIKTNLTRRI